VTVKLSRVRKELSSSFFLLFDLSIRLFSLLTRLSPGLPSL
jgi:hypothetical protein